jgi:uncharacterized protein (TIGR00369 family)
MSDAVSQLRGLLPWTRSCFVCGQDNPHGLHAKSRLENGRVVLEYTTRDSDLGYQHIVHGGLLMTLADEAMTWAAIAHMRRVCVAAELTVRLRKPVPPGTRLRVEAWCEQVGSRLARTRAIITASEGAEVVSAEGKYMPMPAAEAQLAEKDFVASSEAISPEQLTSANGV